MRGLASREENLTWAMLENRDAQSSNPSDFYRRFLRDVLDAPTSDAELFRRLREERNRIVHRGEPSKRLEITPSERIGEPSSEVPRFKAWFHGTDNLTVNEVCQRVIDYLHNVVSRAKVGYWH